MTDTTPGGWVPDSTTIVGYPPTIADERHQDELATLRRELAEARAEAAAMQETITYLKQIVMDDDNWETATTADLVDWVQANADVVANDQMALEAGRSWQQIRQQRDEAVAETARVRNVYRDALARWRDELTQLRKAVTTITARRERERPDDIIVDALRAALDGAATTGPETAPAEGGAS